MNYLCFRVSPFVARIPIPVATKGLGFTRFLLLAVGKPGLQLAPTKTGPL